MLEAGSIIFRIQAAGAQVFAKELDQADQAAKRAAKSTSDAAKSTEELGKKSDQTTPKVKSIRDEIAGLSTSGQAAARDVGRALTVVGIAVGVVAGLTVKAAKDWETAWTGVTKTVDGTSDEMAQLEGDLRGLTKILPATHEEIAAVAEAAGQLGVQRENVAAFTKTMIDLGETTNLSADEAATSLAQFMNIFQTAPEDVGRLGAAVVALGNDGASTERDIVQMSQRLAGAAKVIGLTEGETLGLANALASVGIEAEAGGSAVSNIMIDIANAVSENGDDLKQWAKVAGVSADEFAQRFRTKPAEALNLVIQGMGRLQKSGGDVFGTLQALGQTDVRVTRALLNLAGAGNLLADSLELGNQAWEDNTALQDEAAKRYATTDSKIQLAKNAVMDMAIELGDHLLPVVNDVAAGVKNFSDFIGGMPDELQGAVVVLGLVVAGVALVGGTALIAVPKIVAFRAALKTLDQEMPSLRGNLGKAAAFLSGPWGIAITAATLGVQLLGDYLDSLQASSEEITASLTSAKSAADIFATAGKGKDVKFWTDVTADLGDLNNVLQASADQYENVFARFDSSHFGAFEALKDIGTELGTLAQTDLPSAQRAFSLLAAETDGSKKRLWELLSNMPAYRDQLIVLATANGDYTETMTEAEKKQVLLDYAMRDGGDAATRNAKSTNAAADAYLNAADASAQLYDQLDKLLTQLNEANDAGSDAISANIDYQDALRGVREQIDEINKGTEGYARTLDITTEAGSKNYSMLLDAADAGRKAADAQFALDGNTDAYVSALQANRETILQNARDLGATDEQLQYLADHVLAIPDQKTIEILAETWKAAKMLDDFVAKYNGKSITMGMFLDTSGGNKAAAAAAARYTGQAYAYLTNQADGGVRYAADGLLSQQQAQFRRAGSYVMWAEDETQGETFIPHAPSKRGRSTQLLRATANEFGYDLVPHGQQRQASSDAAIMAGSSRPAEQRVTGTLKVDLTNGEAYLDGVLLGELR